MAELKTKESTASVKAFIKSLDDSQKQADSKELVKIFSEVTGKKPKMWGSSIIGFDKYRYKTKNGQEYDWLLTGFSPRKAQISIYIMTGFKDHQDLLDKLGKHKVSSGSCLYIKKLDDISIPVLKKIIQKSISNKDKLI